MTTTTIIMMTMGVVVVEVDGSSVMTKSLRALHSPFDLLDPSEFLHTCAPLMNAWFPIFFFFD